LPRVFSLIISPLPPPPRSPLFPYTTLFRSRRLFEGAGVISTFGDELYAALLERRTVPPLTSRADLSIEDAYNISLRLRDRRATRSEEHTSELQSLRHLVCRLLLEKKKE